MILGIQAYANDDSHFLPMVDDLIRGVVSVHSPQRFMVFRIDNWFGQKWLRFAGKAMGAFGVWSNTRTTIPSFVQNRITSQSYFKRTNTDQYTYSGTGSNIHNHGASSHNHGASSHNLGNHAKANAPDTALFWFSGRTLVNARGSIMGYTPCPDRYWGWYLGFERLGLWKVAKQVDFRDCDLSLARGHNVTLLGT